MGGNVSHNSYSYNSLSLSLFLSFSLSVTSEEYKLLHGLNQVTIAKYQDMTALAGGLNEVSLSDKCKLNII